MKRTVLILFFVGLLLNSCKDKEQPEIALPVNVPVTLTTIDSSGISSYTDLNATATYIIKTPIKANTTGYLNSVNVASNEFVHSGKVLFTLKTRESKVLGNTVNKLDPALNFGNAIRVLAPSNGYVNSVNVTVGNYVQDGDVLATISDSDSFAIVLSLPYELKKYLKIGMELEAVLPDDTVIKVRVQQFMPTVDVTSQTQNVVLKIIGKQDIPENLILKVRVPKEKNTNGISLPKAAVLSNETETQFWIMKMIDANTAVRIPIKKGIETDEKVEILSPVLTSKDRILKSGNYGVADTIKVKVLKNN